MVVVAAPTEDGHSGQIYELSGPEAGTPAEAVATISEHAGREVRYADEYLADGVERAFGRPARTFAEFARTTAEEGG